MKNECEDLYQEVTNDAQWDGPPCKKGGFFDQDESDALDVDRLLFEMATSIQEMVRGRRLQ